MPYLEDSQLHMTQDLVKFIEENGNKWDDELIYKRGEILAGIGYDHIWNL